MTVRDQLLAEGRALLEAEISGAHEPTAAGVIRDVSALAARALEGDPAQRVEFAVMFAALSEIGTSFFAKAPEAEKGSTP